MWVAQAAPTADSLPIQGGALVLLGVVIYYFVRKAQRDEDRRDKEAAEDAARASASAMEAANLHERLSSCRDEIAEQRRQKHDAINKYAAAQGRVSLAREFAQKCTCDARESLLKVLEDPIGGQQ